MPRWRSLLEARWQARLRELTELSLAYHAAAADGDEGRPDLQELMDQAGRARRKLVDIEEALGRLAAGAFGRCEQCGAQIPDGLLVTAPEIRYCARCDGEPSWIRPLAGRTAR
jgi:DnaK suppressor protein